MTEKTHEFKKIIKYCENCNKRLSLRNARDVKRKRFCSRSCCSLFLIRSGVLHSPKVYTEEMKANMRKPHNITEKLRKSWVVRGLAQRGENHHFWMGGITVSTRARANTQEWRKLAKAIIKRDNYECQLCGEVEGLTCHHIIPFRETHDNSPENLTTLCKSCHIKEDFEYFKNKSMEVAYVS